MLKNWRIVATVLAAFVIVNSIPVGFVYWKVAEWRLPQIRAESLAHATPFESIPRSQWVGETANTFAFNEKTISSHTYAATSFGRYTRTSRRRAPSVTTHPKCCYIHRCNPI
jgi:hypothetical protein